jgi:archaellum component FlaG (FlaF/FlaG flagellin family)
MKKIIILAIAAMSFASCQQSASTAGTGLDSAGSSTASLAPASADAAILTFEKPGYDFGKIKSGEKVQYAFKFKNTGKSPLIITNATATCGCTVPETPKDPIKPGAEGVIKVVFDSTGKSGMQDKVITVTSNGNPSVSEVHLVGVVNPA